MTRDFQFAPRFPLSTKFGPLEVTVCRGNELYVTSHGGEPIVINRVEHHDWIRLQHPWANNQMMSENR